VSRLFISAYLDEDVSVVIARLLRSRGYSAVTTLEAGQIGRSDADQLAFATERQMAILTHNRDDFVALAHQYVASARNHCGIIISVRRPPHEITHRLLSLFDRVTAEEMDNQLLYI
jgi:predicted nuclease of predicted toxin-antitoxin system